jgi:ABC-type sugar transport system substrate-binding protein
MGKLVPPGSKVAVIAGMLRAEDHRKKADAFVETFPQHCAGGKIIKVIEGHEDEDESFQKTFDLLRRVPNLAGIYVNTVNCLPVCAKGSLQSRCGNGLEFPPFSRNAASRSQAGNTHRRRPAIRINDILAALAQFLR